MLTGRGVAARLALCLFAALLAIETRGALGQAALPAFTVPQAANLVFRLQSATLNATTGSSWLTSWTDSAVRGFGGIWCECEVCQRHLRLSLSLAPFPHDSVGVFALPRPLPPHRVA